MPPGPTSLACTLDNTKAQARLQRWRDTLTNLVDGVEQPDARHLHLILAANPDAVVALVALAQAETSCCSFFDFTLHIDAAALTLVVEVPADSEKILDNFARLAAES